MNKALIKKGFIVGLIGFAVGVPVGLAFLLMNASEEHSVTFIALQLILSGVLGGIALGSSVVYEAESWSVTRCTVTHFVVTFATYFTIGFSMGWFPLDDIGTYIMIGSMFVAYFMIGSILNMGFWYFQIGMMIPFAAIALFVIMFMVAFGKQREQEAKERQQYYSEK